MPPQQYPSVATLPAAVQVFLCRDDVGEHLIPGNPAAQVTAGGGVVLSIAEFDPGTDAVEQCRRDDMIAVRREADRTRAGYAR